MNKKITNIARAFCLATLGAVMAGCNTDPDPIIVPTDEHTVIFYMVANNNLSRYAVQNINMMESAYNDDPDNKVLIFYNTIGGESEILELKKDQSEAIASEVLYQFPEDTNPTDPVTLMTAIAKCREFSETERYSLVLWSHATGWLPDGMSPAKSPLRSFGNNYGSADELEINDLAAALPTDLTFEYIYFDACHMGSVEAAFEMRHNAKYYISSAAEVLANGYPYDTGLDALLKADAEGIARNFFEYYNAQSGVNQSATISAVDLSKLDAVAAEFAKMPRGVEPTAQQQFGRYLGSSSNFQDLFWDLGDMIERTWSQSDAAALQSALSEAVIYKAATPLLFKGDYFGEIEVDTFSGLTVYIPRLSQPITLDIYTNNYSWAKETKFYEFAY